MDKEELIEKYSNIEGLTIEELENDLDNLNNWISVEDKLPENDDDVLISINDDYTKKDISSLGNFADSEWLINGCNENTIAGITVTHWQPLPQPPKK